MGAFDLDSFLFILYLVITQNWSLDDLKAMTLTVINSSNSSTVPVFKSLLVVLLSGHFKRHSSDAAHSSKHLSKKCLSGDKIKAYSPSVQLPCCPEEIALATDKQPARWDGHLTRNFSSELDSVVYIFRRIYPKLLFQIHCLGEEFSPPQQGVFLLLYPCPVWHPHWNCFPPGLALQLWHRRPQYEAVHGTLTTIHFSLLVPRIPHASGLGLLAAKQ